MAGAPAAAGERPPTVLFEVPAAAYSQALIDFALQAKISLFGAETCPGASTHRLQGRMTVAAGLDRLLAGSGCRYEMIDPRTARILPPAAPGPTRPVSQDAAPIIAPLQVTATKRQQSADRIAGGVSVVSREQLALTRAADPSDIVGQVAGLLTTNLGPARDKLLVRGLSDGVFTGRVRATVGAYLDGAPTNYDAPNPDLRLVDVERVEVVRGPQGALYGDGALAGVYRIVTRSPDLHAYEAAGSTEHAWTEGGSPSHALELVANVPIVGDRLAMRWVVYHEIKGGYLNNLALRRAHVDHTLRAGGRAALRFWADAAWTIDLSGAWQNLRSSDTHYSEGRPSRLRANRVAEAHENRFGELSLTIKGELPAASLTSTTAYVRHQFASLYDATSALDLYAEPRFQVGVYAEGRRVRMLTEDLVLSSPAGHRLGWLAGLYAAGIDEQSPAALRALGASAHLTSLYDEARRDRTGSLAAYGELSYSPAPGWLATAGGRLVDVRLSTASQVTAPARGRSRVLAGESRLTAFAPKLSIQRDLGAHDGAGAQGLIYLLYSTGFRPGGVNSSGLLPLSRSRASFAADDLRNVEVGVKWRDPTGRQALRGAVFLDRWRDIQSDRYLPSGLAYTANIGDAVVGGLEAEAQWRAAAFTLQAELLMARSRLTRRNPDLVARLAGSLPGVPTASGGLVASYARPLAAGLTAQLTARVSLVGFSRLTFDAATPRMGGYVDAQLIAGLQSARWSGEVFLSNPADAAGDTFAYGNPFSFGRVRQATPQRPRTVGVALSAAF